MHYNQEHFFYKIQQQTRFAIIIYRGVYTYQSYVRKM